MPTKAYAASAASSPLAPFSLERRNPRPKDVVIDILFCGVCHSDLHQARNEWHNTVYPCVPGHEIVGRISRVGAEVTKFKEGELAAVGCLVDSCGSCPSCHEGFEQYCENGQTFTYNSPDPAGSGHTFGGYSEQIVVTEDFVLRVP
ncbi:MAG: alcohol dehydrogenase catalytic domain-containing protein, partial [Verrucomicrobiales bacterium]